MGRLAGSYGVRGWVKVAPQKGVAQALAAATEWWLGEEARRVEQAKLHGATVVAKLAGIESREQALEYKGRKVAVARSALPDAPDGRYYLADLVGLAVVNGQGVKLGTLRRWFSNGPQDLMEVAGEKTRLVPWVAAVVKRVDLDAKLIEVDWGADW